MPFTSKKKNKLRKCWDREDDLHDYLKYKNTQNKNQNKFNYFKNLLHKIVIKHPKPDPELVQFTGGSASIVQSHILGLQDQNRDNNAEENLTEDEEDYDVEDDDVEEIDMMHVDHDPMDNEVSARKGAEFRERLMNEVNRPYCEEECNRLLQEFNLRKRVQKQKILRGVEKIYEGDHDGKSYHDHNLDLAKQIDAAGDNLPKVLRLLRGFFFWLTNLTDEGAFLPWRAPLDLDVLQQH